MYSVVYLTSLLESQAISTLQQARSTRSSPATCLTATKCYVARVNF
jgi:hypothetical protein